MCTGVPNPQRLNNPAELLFPTYSPHNAPFGHRAERKACKTRVWWPMTGPNRAVPVGAAGTHGPRGAHKCSPGCAYNGIIRMISTALQAY